MTKTRHIEFKTRGRNEIVNLTDDLRRLIEQTPCKEGFLLIFVCGATGALSTIEFEPGLVRDWPELMERLIPQASVYHHNETWHDGNGHSHLRATLVGPSVSVPFKDGSLLLGTWQQVVFMEFDNKPHVRRIVVQIHGE